MQSDSPFQEANLRSTPIRDLGLRIEGTRLEPLLTEFEKELADVGIRKLRPHFYLSTEWGVPTDTVAIAIPFYLARPDLTDFHARRTGYVEGFNRWDVLRYLRHEMGHVVNYAYRLYDTEDWVRLFGAITQPYRDDYHPQPFSRRFVVHLPGWYAQKHPDEDWSETFAVWLTPGRDWRNEYRDWPEALRKLEYCERTMQAIGDQEPLITDRQGDEDVSEITQSVEEYYSRSVADSSTFPPGLDGALMAIFEDYGRLEDTSTSAPRRPASQLIRKLQRELLANVYRWTGHFPERTQLLLNHLEERADKLRQMYPEDREAEATVAVTSLVCALAMNHVHRGTYFA